MLSNLLACLSKLHIAEDTAVCLHSCTRIARTCSAAMRHYHYQARPDWQPGQTSTSKHGVSSMAIDCDLMLFCMLRQVCASSMRQSLHMRHSTRPVKPAGRLLVFCCCSARRVQNMGWTPTNTLWLATRGGDVYFGSDRGAVGSFDQAKLGSRGFGILDVGYTPSCSCLGSEPASVQAHPVP